MEESGYIVRIEEPEDFPKVRNWAASLGEDIVAHGCYDRRRSARVRYHCLYCGRTYNKFKDLEEFSIDEDNGRVYSEVRVCKCPGGSAEENPDDNNVTVDEHDATCSGYMIMKVSPNVMIVGKIGSHPLLTPTPRKYAKKIKPDPTAIPQSQVGDPIPYWEMDVNILDPSYVYLTGDSNRSLQTRWKEYVERK